MITSIVWVVFINKTKVVKPINDVSELERPLVKQFDYLLQNEKP